MAAIRRWARDGEVDVPPDEARARSRTSPPSWRRPGCASASGPTWPGRATPRAPSASCLAAAELAPDDLTIWRAAMPLLGDDPFGDAFFAKFEDWTERGAPFNGLPPVED